MSGNPWIAGKLTIVKHTLDQIEAHARQCYPSESCGFIAGPVSEPGLLTVAFAETNEADKYHALDPARFPRTSRMYFKINELRAARAFEGAERKGEPIKVIYHSHCDAGAYFSDEDAATFAIDGALMWPCAFLVVSVMAGEIKDRKLWVHKAGTNEFVESELRVS